MTTYLLILASALFLAVAVTPLARRMAFRFGMIDQPAARKQHVIPTPLLGGAAIYLAFIISLFLLGDRFYISQVAGILLGATLVSFLGFWDDRRALGPFVKLAGQLVAALILVVTDIRVNVSPWPWLNTTITLVWVVGITNAVNFLDNMDGLSAGIAGIAASFFLLFAAMSKQYLVGALAAALLGACIGFLFYNFNPARIFHGRHRQPLPRLYARVGRDQAALPGELDVRYLDGAGAGAGGAHLRHHARDDLTAAARGLNPLTTPGKDHISHRLARLTGSPREAVLLCYLLGGIGGMIATFVTQANIAEGYAVGLTVLLLGIYGIWRLEKVPLR